MKMVVHMMYSNYNDNKNDENVLEKFLETSMVVKMAPFSFLLALNFFKQSTVSCLKKFHREKEKGCNNFSLKYLGWNGCRPVEHAGHPLSLADPRGFQSLENYGEEEKGKEKKEEEEEEGKEKKEGEGGRGEGGEMKG